MRILVDKIPDKPQACLFSKCDPIFEHYFCTLRCGRHGHYQDCVIKDGKKCRWLKEIDK